MILRIAAFIVALFLALMAIPAFDRACRFAFEGRGPRRTWIEIARGGMAIAASAALCLWILRTA